MHVLLFDIDGTLISSGGAGKAALEVSLRENFGITHPIENLSLSGRTDTAIVHDLLTRQGIPDTMENRQRLFGGYLAALPECLQRLNGRILPGIAELLTELRERRDVLVGLLTGNIRAGARVKLGFFGLYDHFPFGGFGDLHHDRDDVAREALAEVHQRLNGSVVLERVWVLGDTPLDVRCARAIGARVAAIATGFHTTEELAPHKPDLLLGDLSNTRGLLDCIFGRDSVSGMR